MRNTSASRLVIPEPRLVRSADGMWRLTAEVAGQEIYFESLVKLSPRIEAFVCPLWFPAMAHGWDLELGAPLTTVMRENLQWVQNLARQWWPGFSASEMHGSTADPLPRVARTGLFFTGGVDSTFALRQSGQQVDDLIFVEGFDVPLDDAPQLDRVRRSLAAMASATGHSLVVVRTNLRSHRLFKSLDWEVSHVAALAGVAHALGEHLGTVYLADSDVPPPYGSHPELDERWSSDSVVLKSIGAGHSRLQRVKAICDWPPASGHLRVCWKNSEQALNCGRCKKCLLTRLALQVAGDSGEMHSFPALPLMETLERVAQTDPGSDYPHFWQEVMAELKDPRMRAAIETMLKSPARRSFKAQWKRWFAKRGWGK